MTRTLDSSNCGSDNNDDHHKCVNSPEGAVSLQEQEESVARQQREMQQTTCITESSALQTPQAQLLEHSNQHSTQTQTYSPYTKPNRATKRPLDAPQDTPDIDVTINKMDADYNTQFYSWIRNPGNREYAALRMRPIAEEYNDLAHTARVLKWISADWTAHETDELIKLMTASWSDHKKRLLDLHMSRNSSDKTNGLIKKRRRTIEGNASWCLETEVDTLRTRSRYLRRAQSEPPTPTGELDESDQCEDIVTMDTMTTSTTSTTATSSWIRTPSWTTRAQQTPRPMTPSLLSATPAYRTQQGEMSMPFSDSPPYSPETPLMSALMPASIANTNASTAAGSWVLSPQYNTSVGSAGATPLPSAYAPSSSGYSPSLSTYSPPPSSAYSPPPSSTYSPPPSSTYSPPPSSTYSPPSSSFSPPAPSYSPPYSPYNSSPHYSSPFSSPEHDYATSSPQHPQYSEHDHALRGYSLQSPRYSPQSPQYSPRSPQYFQQFSPLTWTLPRSPAYSPAWPRYPSASPVRPMYSAFQLPA